MKLIKILEWEFDLEDSLGALDAVVWRIRIRKKLFCFSWWQIQNFGGWISGEPMPIDMDEAHRYMLKQIKGRVSQKKYDQFLAKCVAAKL